MTFEYTEFKLFDAALAFLTQMMFLDMLPGITSIQTTKPASAKDEQKWSITIS